MKKILMSVLLIGIIAVIIVVLHKTNANAVKTIQDANESSDKTDIVITDSYFIQSTNDIYLNMDSYIGQTIKMEGYIYMYYDDSGEEHYAVVRNSPGCCGNDGLAGLDIEYGQCPPVKTWVEVIGIIKEGIINNQRTPIIEVTSMTEKSEGMTFVTN